MGLIRSMQRFQGDSIARELRAYSIYRAFTAALIALVVVGFGGRWIGEATNPELTVWICSGYLLAALALLLFMRTRVSITTQIAIGTLLDLFFANAVVSTMPATIPVVALILIINVAAASLLLSLPFGLATAALASATFIAQFLLHKLEGDEWNRPLLEPVMFAISYFAIAWLSHQMGRRMAETESVATKRGTEVADLAAVNELIIRRMPTGVVIVGGDDMMRLANEAALNLLGQASDGHRPLGMASPELAKRLRDWRAGLKANLQPVRMGVEQTEISPQFFRLHQDADDVLVFLDDTSQASRRAESITLAALGRFSASLAHEIRNPLAAISYSTQLMEESREMAAMDRQMLAIVRQQVTRMNGIIESVLSLARRERAQPEPIALGGFIAEFVQEYTRSYPLDADTLSVMPQSQALMAMADPKHVHQILMVLVSNARYYGRMPNQPAIITIRTHRDGLQPAIDVIDQGPGIPDSTRHNLFRPFFTTSEHGTGLGLHIAKELASANQGTLTYQRLPSGSCFRLRLPSPDALLRRPEQATALH